MKHDGVVQVIENSSDGGAQPPPPPPPPGVTSPLANSDVTISVVSKDNASSGGSQFRCDICSFTCASVEAAIAAHMQHHTPQPGANFKCTYCPYYVADKQSLSEHMALHGTATLTPLQSRKAPGDGPQSIVSAGASGQGDQQQIDFVSFGPPEPQSPHRPFKCTHCPYASEQRVMFLQHRQMHVPRGQPFRCPACTFSTNQRAVLITHARLHGLQPRQPGPPAPLAPLAGGRESAPGAPAAADKPRRTLLKPERSTIAGPTLKDSETRHLDEVPLVWVSRGGKFFKMFKCRQCPHVNLRKSNIQDHEKMHTDRDLAGYAHRCTKCNYVCINAGVLSGHLKVHTYWLGKIHAIVDMKRTDDQQLREILGEDYANDVEVVADKTLSSQPPALGGGVGVTPPVTAAPETSAPAAGTDPQRVLYFCQHCPARFFHDNEIKIHSRFHGMNLPFTCEQCSYTARQHPHLLAHLKVHSEEYRERTRSLLAIYTTSADHPPRAPNALSSNGTPSSSGAVPVKKPLPSPVQGLPRPAMGITSVTASSAGSASFGGAAKIKRYRCGLCPARFMKEATLRYHQSLHGSNGPFRCTRCNYAVKTYGNLVQHLNLHSESDQKGGSTSELSRPRASAIDDFPMSGVDLLKRKLDFEKEYNGVEMPSKKVMRFAPATMMDPSSPYYAERTGNPDFAYPTVLDKYGREREKRYKCQKCPSAFEKREQYIKHISLHNSQNRYTCTVCDYSVKYYPNFCNHMKRHGIRPPPMLEAANASVSAIESRSTSPAVDADGVRLPARANYTGAPELTAVERQQLVLQRVKEEQDAFKDEEPTRKVHWCELCPYANTRRGTTEDHRWRHRFYGSRGGFGCRFCDYACQQSHLLREHHKLHFRASKYVKVDSYTQLVGLEVFMKEIPEGEDKENLDFSHVDVSDHDLLFRASEMGADEPRPDPKSADPSMLVDVSNGELVCEKPEQPTAAANGQKEKNDEEINDVKEEEDQEESGKEDMNMEENDDAEEDGDEEGEDAAEEKDADMEEDEGEEKSTGAEQATSGGNEVSQKSVGEDDMKANEAEDVMTQEEAAVNAITQEQPAAAVEPQPAVAEEAAEFEVPEDDGEAAAAVLALQAAEMAELEPPDLTIGQPEQMPPPLDDDDQSEPPVLTGDDQAEPPPALVGGAPEPADDGAGGPQS